MDKMDLILERIQALSDDMRTVKDHCASIDVTLAKNASDIEHHIKRTDVLETIVDKNHDDSEQDTKELQAGANQLRGALALFAFVALVLEIWHYLN